MNASPYDAPLSAIRNNVENLGAWLAIWEARREPDAHARRCAADAVDAIDAALRDLYAIRQQLISEVQQADRATAIRADALLARTADAIKLPGPDRAGTEEDRALGPPGLG